RQDLPAAPTADCPTCPTLTRSVRLAVCGSGVHCIGSIAGQAIWHLRNNLLSGDDYVSGLPLAAGNPALSSLQMRWLLERWLLGGGVPMETWDPTAAGVSIYDAVMVADDDDQNLANGTPHAAYINAAFSHHEIDESPQLPDSTNCAAPADPLVSVLVQPGEDGLPRVRIDWLGGGPGTFDVLRRRFSGDTFLPVARDVVAGPVLDEDVSAGESWEYLVQADSGGGCRMVSPGLNVEAVSVNLPALEVRLLEFRENPGDGDLLVEPGESADLDLEIVEVGGVAGATGVNLTLSSMDPSVAVSQGGPMAWGDVAAGLTVAGPAPFQLRLADDLPCGSQVVVLLQVDAMETCGSTALRLPLAVVCDSAGEAFVRAVPGSLQVVADTGDQDGLADNCELATLSYELENAGGSASGMVTSTVTALDGRSRVVGGGVWQYVGGGAGALSGLLPGESVTAFFSADLAGWDGPGVAPFAVQTVASQSSGVVTVDLETAIEEDPPLYATQSFDFEGGSQGWTGDGFVLSTSRANSGTQSFHGGTTSASWLCQHLLSPVFRLDPAGGAAVAMQVYADIEPFSSGTWWDRANVHLLEVDTGRHVLLTPLSGRAYTADPAASLEGQLCHVDLEEGWAGNLSPPFAAVSFDLSPWSGREIRIEVNYSSDGGDDREGIYIDDVVFTGAATPPQDSQSDLCGFAPEVSPPGSPVPLGVELNGGDLLLTWEDLGTGFAYNVYSGTVGNWFDHGLAPLACAGSGVTCDGASCSWTSSGLPAGQAYYLVTASRDGRQGPSGFTTAGIPRDPTADSCLP
ncbi:MAG: hypothetical protein O7D35_08470, partial [Acidobacteria bacterium]|nr:hypothetical protein [Acidobacteriota bacterium]